MIVDSSSLVAILFEEPETDIFLQKIKAADGFSISAASVLESSIVHIRRRPASDPARVLSVIALLDGNIVPVTLELTRLAIQAFERYGKGRHPAQLNFGDCFSYALAKHLKEPILFKGNAFSQTDLHLA